VELVHKSAMEELAEIDYLAYDFAPLECIIGDNALHFCRLLKAADSAAMKQRMNGLKADLALIDRKLKRFSAKKEPLGEVKYRIALYNHTYEAVICGRKGGWLWKNLI
jgi:hypothetical protein